VTFSAFASFMVTCVGLILSELPKVATNAGRLISGGGSDNKIQIGCNIRQLPQFVNVSFPDKSRQGRRLSP
jgi:hypothetical protein